LLVADVTLKISQTQQRFMIMSQAIPISVKDLSWSLKHHQAPDQAFALMKAIENRLAVYSRTVNKIYTNYTVHKPTSNATAGLVILPDFSCYHDMIHNIPVEAIEATGLKIIPGAAIARDGLYLTGKLKGREHSSALPLKTGVKAMKMGAFCDGPFLPILQYGDLREMEKKQIPYLVLNRIRLDKLVGHSLFECQGISRNILKSLEKLAQADF